MVFQAKAPGDGLLIERIGFLRRGGLIGFRSRFGPGHMFHSGQRQQITEFRGFQHPWRRDHPSTTSSHCLKGHRFDSISLHRSGDRTMPQQEGQPSVGNVRSQHRFQNSQSQSRLMAQPGDPSATWIDPRHGLRGCVQRRVPQKSKPNLIPELAVTPSTARLLDPRMLIGRHRLRGELTSDPESLFGEHNALSRTAGCQSGRHPPDPTPDDQHRCRN